MCLDCSCGALSICQQIERAASIIQQGGLVAFPTETVYGLGANALDPHAVKKIFVAKGRPSDNPLIVHIADYNDVFKLAREVPETALKLAQAFWPGPLTLVLPKAACVPDEVVAGGDTVAVRMPNHPIALALIKAAGVPIAAPSANRSGRPSPTTAAHVRADLGDAVDMILEGAPAQVGVESTVVDCTSAIPQILRPGGVSYEQLATVVPDILPFRAHDGGAVAKSPGMKYRHYAPRAPLILVGGERMSDQIVSLVAEYRAQYKKVGVLACDEHQQLYVHAEVVLSVGARHNLVTVAQNLFAVLRSFDDAQVDVIIAESFPEAGLGVAIMDRLKRAAQG